MAPDDWEATSASGRLPMLTTAEPSLARPAVRLRQRWAADRDLIVSRCALAGSLLAWLGLQYVHRSSFLYHDAWRHNFPRLYSMTKLSACGDIPRSNGKFDSGWRGI